MRIIAPFAPGGGTDFIARIAAQKLTEALGSSSSSTTGPAPAASLGAELGAKAPPDGYTLTLIAGSYAVNPSIYKLAFDPVNDITPIIQMSQGPLLIAAHPTLPAKTAKDVIAIGKAKPGQPALRDERPGQHRPSRDRVFRRHGRHQDDARAVQGHRPRADRYGRRARRSSSGAASRRPRRM